jgi:hypothetical protein
MKKEKLKLDWITIRWAIKMYFLQQRCIEKVPRERLTPTAFVRTNHRF